MYTNSEGIVFRQIKTSNGRKMVILFTKKYGKISAGSSINEKGKTKASLAMRPFTFGTYELYKNREYYNVNSADVKKSFYKIGENVDKYMIASYGLELTEKLTVDDMPAPGLFNLFIDFLEAIETRESKYETILIAYEVKALKLVGTFPELKECTICGSKEALKHFSISNGGMVCEKCENSKDINRKDTLIYRPDFDIISTLEYFANNNFKAFQKIALEDDIARELQGIIKEYMSYHLGVGQLKSESIFKGNF